jgi:hypothetical protein
MRPLWAYARCYLSADRRRSFAPAIGFSHKSLQITFFAFHRYGLLCSLGMSFLTPEGFQAAVKYMVGILSIQDEEAFGLDTTRRGKLYRINDRDYQIGRPICVRQCVRGRTTAMYSLKCVQLPISFIHISLTRRVCIQYAPQGTKITRSTCIPKRSCLPMG